MNTYIALFRGINVGGHNKLRMKELRAMMHALGYQNVETYIQSGNVVFQAETEDREKISKHLREAVKEHCGFEPEVLVLDPAGVKKAVEQNPFPEAGRDPKSLHVSFLVSEPSSPDLALLDDLKKESERYKLLGSIFYLYAPEGIGRSKLAGKVEKVMGVSGTGRNWRTVKKIMAMVEKNSTGGQ